MAPRKKNLRAVSDDEILPPSEPMSVFDAAESGSRVDELRAMRAVLARAIDSETTSPRDLAALTRRQMEISREIESLRAQAADEAREAAKQDVVTDRKWRPEAI